MNNFRYTNRIVLIHMEILWEHIFSNEQTSLLTLGDLLRCGIYGQDYVRDEFIINVLESL